jgi:hypothetical protein
MSFLLHLINCDDVDAVNEAYKRYRRYMDSIKEIIPRDAFSFATADWHYDGHDHRSPHDAWLESLTIEEHAMGLRNEERWIDIYIKLLGAYHDGNINIKYEKVIGYFLAKESFIKKEKSNKAVVLSHGDWLIDEISLSESGEIIHEIIFDNDIKWTIRCGNIVYKWDPF